MVGNKVLHELDNSISQGRLWYFVPVKQNTILEMQESMVSTSKSLMRFQLREIAKEAKSFVVENKALAALFVLITAGQLGFLST